MGKNGKVYYSSCDIRIETSTGAIGFIKDVSFNGKTWVFTSTGKNALCNGDEVIDWRCTVNLN